MKANAAYAHPHPRFVDEILPALWWAAGYYGVDPVVMAAQSAHETGWGHYPGLVPPYFHNTCGLKVRDLTPFPNSEVTEAHASFPDWPLGARAHAQHLLAYCQVAVPDSELVDPRYVWVYGKKPAITTVEELGGKWAPSTTYGTRIAETVAKLRA